MWRQNACCDHVVLLVNFLVIGMKILGLTFLDLDDTIITVIITFIIHLIYTINFILYYVAIILPYSWEYGKNGKNGFGKWEKWQSSCLLNVYLGGSQ